MKIGQIYKILDEIAPFELQESWDNSGLLVGSFDDEISQIYLSLDIDDKMLDKIEPNSLIIAHHPLIFKGLKKISSNLYPGKLIYKMIKKNISLVAMHTNYDLSILNEYFVREILGFEISKKDGFLIYCDIKMSFDELVNLVKHKLNLSNLRISKVKDEIRSIAICTGSGGDLISSVRADCFLTGDLKYHQAFEALENGLNLIDIGHFESERYFADSLFRLLQKNKINAKISNSINPFQYF